MMEKSVENVEMVMDGQEQLSIDQIYTLYSKPIYSFILRYTRDEQLSMDIVQDTFVRFQSTKRPYDPLKGTLKAFLFQMAYRLMVNKLNRRKKWKALLPFLVPDPVNERTQDDKMTIQHAIASLPEQQRAVILLSYYHDLPHKEISKILDIPVGTVKSRLHSAIHTLKKQLEVDFHET
ncbi:RNA polymerase sigma factor [Halobacillus fulvus]|nr:RNA polymerase sigma factor [Halobacillus fulvus]